jgi:AcrR family transcriptional regulator
MTETDSKSTPIRAPKQERSQKRVATILEAARSIIAEKGSAGLSIKGIAEEAGITAGSMYQYFPNKEAIVYALAEFYMAEISKEFENKFSRMPETRDEVRLMCLEIFDAYSQLHCEDPVVQDILMGASVNKETMDLDWQDTLKNRDFMYEISKPFYPEAIWEELNITLLLFILFCMSSTKAAIEAPEEEQVEVLSVAREIFNNMWLSFDQRVDAMQQVKT